MAHCRKTRRFFFIIAFILAAVPLYLNAQGIPSGSPFWSKVRYGGAIGLGFGNNSFNFIASPAAIYPVNPNVALGTNVSFSYARFGEDRFTAYGAGALAYFTPVRGLQLSSEFEQLRVHRKYQFNAVPVEDDYWLPMLFLGIGYNSGPVTFGIRYDVLYDEDKSIYADPWIPFIRVFF
ncbi:alpha-ketoglutarate decarboxylase [Muriicola sp.]|uniref:alpha-ketoglutarate decarboxylase n=1 Tax=Muriicola sp. TaxID=2020856 RepID=UPI00356400EE